MTHRQDTGLRVQTLGLFKVYLEDCLLPETAWGREKAQQLFKYFISYPTRLTPKEQLFEDIWPGVSQEQAERDFKVALNALNDTLEPQRPSRSLARYLLRQGSSYGLNPADLPYLDYLSFETEVLRLLSAGTCDVAALRQVLALYHGDYLPELWQADWTAALRERLQGLFLMGASTLASKLLQTGELAEAIVWAQQVIDKDPFWEEAYRSMMRAHQQLGNRPQVVRIYRGLQRLLHAELGLEPMKLTTRLYEEALADPLLEL